MIRMNDCGNTMNHDRKCAEQEWHSKPGKEYDKSSEERDFSIDNKKTTSWDFLIKVPIKSCIYITKV